MPGLNEVTKKVWSRNNIFFAGVLLLFGLAVYARSFGHPFVYDDDILSESKIFFTRPGAILAFFTGILAQPGNVAPHLLEGFYRPIFVGSLSILLRIFGASPVPFHIFQFSLFFANCLVIYLILISFFRRDISAILVLFFLAHPLNSEVVMYTSDLQDQLFMLFGLVSLLLASTVRDRNTPFSRKMHYLTGVCLLLSLLSKETAVAFLILLPLFAFLFDRKMAIRYVMSTLTAFLAYLCLRWNASMTIVGWTSNSVMSHTSLSVRLLTIPKIIWYYLLHFLFPVDFAVGQEWVVVEANREFYVPLIFTLVFVVALATLLWGSLRERKDLKPAAAFFGAWFVGGMVLHSNIYPLDATVADRWFFLPFVGLLGLFGILISGISAKFGNDSPFRRGFFGLSAFIVVISASLCVVRANQWSSPETLFRHDLAIANENPQLEGQYAGILLRQGRDDEAKKHLDRSLALNEKSSRTLAVLAQWHIRRNEYDEAQRYLQRVIEIPNAPELKLAYTQLTEMLLFVFHDAAGAQKIAANGLTLFPEDATLLNDLAKASANAGDVVTAHKAAEKLKLLPMDADMKSTVDKILGH